MNLRHEDHDALVRLFRLGSLRIGNSAECVWRSVAERLRHSGLVETFRMDGKPHVRLSSHGRAFVLRTAT